MKLKNLYTTFFLIILFSVINVSGYGAPKTKVLIPKNANGSVSIVVSGKSYKYYPLSNDEAIVLTTRGPGKLKVISRCQLLGENYTDVDYVVYYRINGGTKTKIEFDNVRVDEKSEFKNTSQGFLTLGENILIELPRGENSIELWSGSKNIKILTRSLFTEIKEKKIDWVSLSPMYPNEPVSLVTNEDVISYYRYTSVKPLKIRVTGPTTLRVLNRVEFDYKMKGRLSYRVEVKEDRKLKNTYMLCSDRSDVTKYKKDKKKTPGKANEIFINVPAGTHIYEINTMDNYSILGRILFPKKDIKLESN
ncbi:MAG TPA: hypothetical protein VIZ21_03280 [Ignavibacteriaceae bacterium]